MDILDFLSVVSSCNDIKYIIKEYLREPPKEWFDNVEEIKYELEKIINFSPSKVHTQFNQVHILLNQYCKAEKNEYYRNTKNDHITLSDRKRNHRTITSKLRRLEYRYNGWTYRADIEFYKKLNIDKNKIFKLF